MPEFLFAPVPHTDAIDFIRSKPVVSREVFDQLLPELQARAFTITGMVPADVAQTVRDLIADVPAGMPWDKQKGLIAKALSPYMAEADAIAKAELLLRVHGQEAYASAADAVMRRQVAVFPYWQYRTMGDSKVRPAHRALNGLVLPANSQFWKTHDPPWEWGCRCIKIPMSDDDVNEIRDRQSKNDLEGGFLLSDRLRQELETTNRLVRGANVYNVAPTGTFKFNPQDLTLSVDQIRARYSPEVWSQFESWARRTDIGPNETRTVWNWINGEPGAPESASTADSETSKSQGPGTKPERQSPVSDAIEIRVRDRAFKTDLENTLSLIDQAHDDGELPKIAVRTMPPSARNLGDLSSSQAEIRVKLGGRWRNLTLAHETGHALDWFAIGRSGEWASEPATGEIDPLIKKWRDAVENSASFRTIQTKAGVPNRDYWSEPKEMFARSYAQYIALKTQNARFLSEVETILTKSAQPWRQWAWDDFRPIAAALDELFASLGWLP